MTVYQAYLEIDATGTCMAHALNLPGCMVRRSNQEAALLALSGAIREYFDWLSRHGEDVQPPQSIIIEVAEVSQGYGPFTPGDAAALFPPDREPVKREELESIYFRCRVD